MPEIPKEFYEEEEIKLPKNISKPLPMQQWEYNIVHLHDCIKTLLSGNIMETIKEILDTFGKEGWEYCSQDNIMSADVFIFKRPKQQ